MTGRASDRDRIIRLLLDGEGLSNARIKTQLNLGDDRYQEVRASLIDDGIVAKFRCRGGGIVLTRKGDRTAIGEDEHTSAVERERDLYAPLVAFLQKQAEEDETAAVVWATDSLRVRGKWQNPDVARIGIEYYRYIRKLNVRIATYEVKQFPRWDVSVVFEAASHHRFSHEAWVVLEWPKNAEFSLVDSTYRIDQISRECQRHGVGLATLQSHYSSHRLHPHIDPSPRVPNDADVEAWLEYALSRRETAAKEFEERIKAIGRGD